jgi:arginine deiminase
MPVINVPSEIAPLKKVLLHRPGKELLNLTPETLEELLFDDIPFLRVAQQEHDAFAKALRSEGVETIYLEDLMAQVLDAHPELREQFIRQWLEEANIHTKVYTKAFFDYINDIKDNKELVMKTIEGINVNEVKHNISNSLVDLVSPNSKMAVMPMPNLYFTRDNFACIGNGVSINKMYSVTRNRETIYGDYIFRYHPEYTGEVEMYYDRHNPFHVEGGDILNINKKTLAIGISQRTEPDAIDALAKNIFASNSPIDTILAFDIPVSRAFMHLDTVFTQIDTDKFTVHPGILGTLRVFEIKAGENADTLHIKEIDDTLENILTAYVGERVELIQCGGGDLICADREQWNDGSNTLCVRPGTVCVYERNEVTNRVLKEHNINVIEIPSAELSRGRGGPRCMSMPFYREA